MGLPPWEGSSLQLFALVTGANSGLGFAICQRLIDEFLTSSGPKSASHLIILLTTRTQQKSHSTVSRLRKHLRHFAEHSDAAKSWANEAKKEREEDGGWSKPYNWRDVVGRVHFFGLVLDLCDLRGVKRVARDLVDGQVVLGEGADGQDEGYVIPKLDVVCMNAGIGGWAGIDWPKAIFTVLTDTVHATTYPGFKIADVGKRAKLQSAFGTGEGEQQRLLDAGGEGVDGSKKYEDEPVLGEVFTANVFGHYMLGHWLMPLLCRPARPLPDTTTSSAPSELSSASSSNVNTPTSSNSTDFPISTSRALEDESPTERSRGRLIWISSVEAIGKTFSPDDIQGLQSTVPYESSKRLTDILTLTAELPGVRKYSQSYFDIPDKSTAKSEDLVSPALYLTHPGICGTEIVPLPWILVQAMNMAFYIARWLGSVWHCILPYTGACAMVWVALMGDDVLERIGQDGKGKWGSSTDFSGNARVKRTEVEGWGWSGRVEESGKDRERRKGRRRGVRDLKEEDRVEFEALGARVWKEMESMRKEWEEWLEKN